MDSAAGPAPAVGDPAAFVDKWRGAWPEWALVDVFVPAEQRPVVDAWHALQFEWQEAAWRGDDAGPGQAKLRWWIEELDGWSNGLRRHPLGAVLQRTPAPWRTAALALPSLAATRARPCDGDEAWSSLSAIAHAVAEVERTLLPGGSDARAVAATWLQARLARHRLNAVPASPGSGEDGAGERLWIRDLLGRWPTARGLTTSRGIALALARSRLARGDAATPLPPWAALWAGWRGARG